MAAAQIEKKYVWALSKNKDLLVFYPTQQTEKGKTANVNGICAEAFNKDVNPF